MKKLIVLSICTSMLMSTMAFANETAVTTDENVTAVPPIAIIDNGDNATGIINEVNAVAVPPLAVVDRDTLEILVPARAAAEALGYTVTWDQELQTATFTKGEDIFNATIGSTEYVYNGEVVLTASAPKLVKGTTYVSPQFINLITPYDGKPEIQDPTGAGDTITTPPVEDIIASLGLSDATIENIFATILPVREELNNKIDSAIEEYKDAYLATGGTEEDYKEPSHQVGIKFVDGTDQYFSVDVYGYMAVGSSNSEDHYFTFDKETGNTVTLEDIYGDDYATFIKNRIVEIATEQELVDPDNYDYFQDAFDSLEITNDTNFYINSDNQLVIVLPKYSVEPGSFGSPEFIITNYSNDLPTINE